MLYPPELRARSVQDSNFDCTVGLYLEFCRPEMPRRQTPRVPVRIPSASDFLRVRSRFSRRRQFPVCIDQKLHFRLEGAVRRRQCSSQDRESGARSVRESPHTPPRLRRSVRGQSVSAPLATSALRASSVERIDRLHRAAAAATRDLLSLDLCLTPPQSLFETKGKRLHGIIWASTPICRMVSSTTEVSAGPWRRNRVISSARADHGVKFGIGTGDICAQIDQVFRLPVKRQRFANLAARNRIAREWQAGIAAGSPNRAPGSRDNVRQPQVARQRDVPIQDRAHSIADRFVEIVAFHQHGKERR